MFLDFPRAARYSIAVQAASHFLQSEHIDRFPFDPFEICRRNGWALIPYSQLAEQEGVGISEICDALRSREGSCCRKNGKYYIFYNDAIRTYSRIRFTVTHEIGHIVLGHLDFSGTSLRDSLTKAQYKILEKEANAFTRNVLAPAPIVERDRLFFNSETLSQFFHISPPVAEIRMKLLETDLYYWRMVNGKFKLTQQPSRKFGL